METLLVQYNKQNKCPNFKNKLYCNQCLCFAIRSLVVNTPELKFLLCAKNFGLFFKN